jgi:regulator of nonsense transcripts 2
MINQRQAAKEEQQRIKNLVLNYDLRESEEQEGEEHMNPYRPNINIHHISAGHEKSPTHHHHNRLDLRSGKERGQRVRKLQLSDVDWYGNPGKNPPPQEREQVPSAVQGRPKGSSPNCRNVWGNCLSDV